MLLAVEEQLQKLLGGQNNTGEKSDKRLLIIFEYRSFFQGIVRLVGE